MRASMLNASPVLLKLAVHGVVRPGLPGDGARGLQIELADLLVLEQAQRILCRNDLESLLGQPLLKQLGQLVVQVVEIRPSIVWQGSTATRTASEAACLGAA